MAISRTLLIGIRSLVICRTVPGSNFPPFNHANFEACVAAGVSETCSKTDSSASSIQRRAIFNPAIVAFTYLSASEFLDASQSPIFHLTDERVSIPIRGVGLWGKFEFLELTRLRKASSDLRGACRGNQCKGRGKLGFGGEYAGKDRGKDARGAAGRVPFPFGIQTEVDASGRLHLAAAFKIFLC